MPHSSWVHKIGVVETELKWNKPKNLVKGLTVEYRRQIKMSLEK